MARAYGRFPSTRRGGGCDCGGSGGGNGQIDYLESNVPPGQVGNTMDDGGVRIWRDTSSQRMYFLTRRRGKYWAVEMNEIS